MNRPGQHDPELDRPEPPPQPPTEVPEPPVDDPPAPPWSATAYRGDAAPAGGVSLTKLSACRQWRRAPRCSIVNVHADVSSIECA